MKSCPTGESALAYCGSSMDTGAGGGRMTTGGGSLKGAGGTSGKEGCLLVSSRREAASQGNALLAGGGWGTWSSGGRMVSRVASRSKRTMKGPIRIKSSCWRR